MVIGPTGEHIGLLSTFNAITMAKEGNFDLVEVAPHEKPPVCRIMDFGKFKYKQNKKAHETKKKQKVIHLKEVKFRPQTEEHDYQFKLKHIMRFLEHGDKAKITVVFKGRELAHLQFGRQIMARILEDVKENGVVELSPKQEGKNMIMILIPQTVVKKLKKESTQNETLPVALPVKESAVGIENIKNAQNKD